MPFVPFDDGARLVVTFAAGQQLWSNGFYFAKLEYTEEDLEALAAVGDEHWGGALLDVMSSESRYVESIAYDVREQFGTLRVNADNAGPGTQNDDMLPIQTALVLTHRTLYRGRSYRGRTYVGGLTEAQFDNGVFSSGVIATVVAAAGGLFAAAQAAGWEPVIASYVANGAPRLRVWTSTIQVTQARNGIPGTQRRRSDRS